MNRIPRGRDYLVHMLDAVGQIQEYTSGKSYSDFSTNRLLQDAVVRNIEILGEASRKLLEIFPGAQLRFPEIPFAAIYAMPNQLVHGYFTVDLQVVWNVIERDIPQLRAALEAALDSEAGE